MVRPLVFTSLAYLLFAFFVSPARAQQQETAKLRGSDAKSGFGRSVAISGDLALIGSPEFVQLGDSGAAYIFERDDQGLWEEVTRLTPSDPEAGAEFGFAVSISGDVAVVSAPRKDLGSELSEQDVGAVYIFERQEAGDWQEVAKLIPPEIINRSLRNTLVGYDVAVSGDVAIIFAPTGAFVYERKETGMWEEVAKLGADGIGTRDGFGLSMAVSGNVAIIGAESVDGVNQDTGAAYVYERLETGTWQEVAPLFPPVSDATLEAHFGRSVAIHGDRAIVGANGSRDTGGAFVFERQDTGQWIQVAKLLPSDAEAEDLFGWSVAIYGEVAVVGAVQEDEGGLDAGAAYVFKRTERGRWEEVDKLVVSDPIVGSWLGDAVTLSEEAALVGARGLSWAYLYDLTELIPTANEVLEAPTPFSMLEAFPNPFAGSTTIAFEVPRASSVRLTVYDLLGREVQVLASGEYVPGRYEAHWDAAGFSSGVYVYRLKAGEHSMTRQLLLLR